MLKRLGLLFGLCFPIFCFADVKLVTLDYPPYIVTHNGDVDGVAVRLVERVFEQLEVPITIDVLPWGRALNYVETGQADGIFTLFKNPEREKFANYTQEVLFHQNIILIRARSSSRTWDVNNTQHIHLCLVSNVSYGRWLDGQIADGQFASVSRVRHAKQCVLQLLFGRVDFWVSNEFGARYLSALLGVRDDIVFVMPPIESTPSYLAFSKKSDYRAVVAAFDHVLQRMKRDGSYTSLIDGYFAELATRAADGEEQ